MLTLAIPQSEPSGERNRSASRRSSVKIAEVSPCSTAFWIAIASSSVAIASSRRGSGRTSPRRRSACRGRAWTSAGSTKKPGPVEPVAAVDDLAPLLPRRVERRHHRLDGLLVDQRAHQDAVVPGIADPDAAVDRDQPLEDRGRGSTRGRSAGGRSCTAGRRCRRRRRRSPGGPARGRRSGVMMIALLPPSSRSDRPSRRPTTSPTTPAHPATAGRRDQGQPAVVEHPLADVLGPADAEA